jgi:hypothetical protein
MIGPFSFLNFSIYGSVDNTSWVLIDSRAGMTSAQQNCAGSCSHQTPLWGLVPKPFVVSSSAQFIQSPIPGVGALVPLKIGDANSPLHSNWSVSIWINPQSCRSPCMPVILLTNRNGQTGGQGQSWVTLELFSLFQDNRTAAFSFTLCMWVPFSGTSFSICSKSAVQIYPSIFSQFVVTYSESSDLSRFAVRMYVNRAEVLSHQGSLGVYQQGGFGPAVVGLGLSVYVDDVVILLGPVYLDENFGTIRSDSVVYGIAVGSELLISSSYLDERVGSSGFAYFLGLGLTPGVGLGVASTGIFSSFSSSLSSGYHSAVFEDYYGSQVYALSSVAAPIHVGIIGYSSGISCQSKSVMLCTFHSSDFFALNPSSSSSLRIVSQGMNAQSGLDLELHSRVTSISPLIPTFAVNEFLVFTGSGIASTDYNVLFIEDPMSFERVYLFCAKTSGQLNCSNSFANMPIISPAHPDGLYLWSPISTPYVNMAIVNVQPSTHLATRKGSSTVIELASFQHISGSASFAVFSGGSFQYEVMVFFSSTVSSPVFVVYNSNPVDLSSVPSSGLGPLCVGATITTLIGNYLLAIPSCSTASISLYRWSVDSTSFQLLRSINLESLVVNLPLLPFKFLAVTANEYFCVSSDQVVFCFNADFVLGTTNARSGVFEIPGIKSLSGLKEDVAHVFVSSDQGLFALSLSNTRFFKYSVSSLVTTKFLLVSNTNHSLLVAWSPVQADFKVYRVRFNSSTPEAPVSLEYRYSGSKAFDQIFEVRGALVVARESDSQMHMFVSYGLSSAQVICPVATYFRNVPIGDIIAPIAIASSVYKWTVFFIDFLSGSSTNGILRSVDTKISSNFLSVNVVARVSHVSSATSIMKWHADNTFAFVGKMFTPMKNTTCNMISGGITVAGVAFSPNERSVMCTIGNWSYLAGDYSFEFPGMIVVGNLLVTVFPFVSGVSVSVFDVEPFPFKIFGSGFLISSTQTVTFVSVGTSGNYSSSLTYLSSSEYRCASPPSSVASGTYSLIITLQQSGFELQVNLGQFPVQLINRPPHAVLPSTYVVDENSLGEFSAIFSVVSPGRSIENSQSLNVTSQLYQSFGIVFSQPPVFELETPNLQLILRFRSQKQFHVGNFTINIRISDNGGTLNGGVNMTDYSLDVRVIAAPRSPFIVTQLNFEYIPRTSIVSNMIDIALGVSLGRQLPYSQNPFVTYSLSSCSNSLIFQNAPEFSQTASSVLSNANRMAQYYVTDNSTSVVNLHFSLALYASGSSSCNLSIVDNTGNSSLYQISLFIPYANRPPALNNSEPITFIQRNYYRLSVDLFPSTNVPQQLENVVVTVLNGELNSNLVRFGSNYIDFYFNESGGKTVVGSLPLSIFLKTNGPSTGIGSNSATLSVTFTILRQNFPPVIAYNSIAAYSPRITIVSTGLQQVVPNVIVPLSIGDDDTSQTLADCSIAGLISTQGLLDGVPSVSSSGSVTLKPRANLKGQIFFNVSCRDDGGTSNGGHDNSNSVSVDISVVLKNTPPMFLDLPSQVTFPEWTFRFGNFDDSASRRAFVLGQSPLSDDFVPSNPSSTPLSQVPIGSNPHIWAAIPPFQQSFSISHDQLSQIPFAVDDWYVWLCSLEVFSLTFFQGTH